MLKRLYKVEKVEAEFQTGEVLSEPSDELLTAVNKMTSTEKEDLLELFRFSSLIFDVF